MNLDDDKNESLLYGKISHNKKPSAINNSLNADDESNSL